MNPMKVTYQDVEQFVDSFANSGSGKAKKTRAQKNAPAWYATWEDNYLGKAIDSVVVRKILRTIVDSNYGAQLDELLAEASELTMLSHPTIYDIYTQCCISLRMHSKPQVYITGRLPGVNALSLEVNKRQVILMSRLATIELSPSELSFVFGHELGHHQQGNLVCHTINGLLDSLTNESKIIGSMISEAVAIPIKRWSRCSEFNADIAGYLCCRDIEIAHELFVKLGMNRPQSAYSRLKEIDSDHPLLSTRFEKVLAYSKSIDL